MKFILLLNCIKEVYSFYLNKIQSKQGLNLPNLFQTQCLPSSEMQQGNCLCGLKMEAIADRNISDRIGPISMIASINQELIRTFNIFKKCSYKQKSYSGLPLGLKKRLIILIEFDMYMSILNKKHDYYVILNFKMAADLIFSLLITL